MMLPPGSLFLLSELRNLLVDKRTKLIATIIVAIFALLIALAGLKII